MNQRATLKTVAEACGLAVTTVSRALNGHDDIASATRAKVKKVAAEIGYVPNREGRALRTGQNHLISLVVPPHALISGYTSSIIFSMGSVLRSHGYELAAMPAPSDHDDLELIQSIVENKSSDGVILARTKPLDLRVKYLLEQGMPFVTHGRTELASPHAYVDYDNQMFTQLAAQRLIDNGCRRLMLIAPPTSLMFAHHMKLGFENTVQSAAVEHVRTPDGLTLETPLDTLRQAMCSCFTSADRPDGIVCGGELAALAVMGAVRDAGLLPAQDVTVIAKQTSSVLDHTYPPIDTCYEDIDSTGRLLAENLLALLGQETQVEALATIVEPQIRWRTDLNNT